MVQTSPFYPLPSPLDKTTKHLTRLTHYISQVIANPTCGRGDKALQPQGLSPQNIPAKAGYSCVKATRFRVKHGMTELVVFRVK